MPTFVRNVGIFFLTGSHSFRSQATVIVSCRPLRFADECGNPHMSGLADCVTPADRTLHSVAHLHARWGVRVTGVPETRSIPNDVYCSALNCSEVGFINKCVLGAGDVVPETVVCVSRFGPDGNLYKVVYSVLTPQYKYIYIYIYGSAS